MPQYRDYLPADCSKQNMVTCIAPRRRFIYAGQNYPEGSY